MGSALFALIAVSLGVIAYRARSGNIAVGKKTVGFAVKKKLFSLFGENPFFLDFNKKLLCCFMVKLRSCSAIIIERDAAL